jgi:hypothetical protein
MDEAGSGSEDNVKILYKVSKKNHARVFVRRNGRDYFCTDFK